MEQFSILFTTTEQPLAERTCTVLEDANIPVWLEHVEVLKQGERSAGFRVLVPLQFSQRASRLTAPVLHGIPAVVSEVISSHLT